MNEEYGLLGDSKKAKQVGEGFSLVLNDSGANLFKSSRAVMNKIIYSIDYPIRYVAVAFHDEDRNEYGDKKTNHYHVVIEFYSKMRVLSCFNAICDAFRCNPNQVSIEKATDVGACVRYLVHLDDCDKYRYPFFIICSNNDEMTDFYLKRVKIKDEKHLLTILQAYPSRSQLLLVLGKKQYKDWRFAIQDLIR